MPLVHRPAAIVIILMAAALVSLLAWLISRPRGFSFVRQFAAHDGDVGVALFSSDQKTLLTASGDCVRLWDVASARNTQTLQLDGGYIRGIAWSGRGDILVTG